MDVNPDEGYRNKALTFVRRFIALLRRPRVQEFADFFTFTKLNLFVLVAVLALLDVIYIYLGYHEPPKWMDKIDWVKKYPQPSRPLVVFALETATFVLIFLTRVVTLWHFQKDIDASSSWQDAKAAIVVFIVISSFLYNMVMGLTEHDFILRVLYACFNIPLLCMWLQNIYILCSFALSRLTDVLKPIRQRAEQVFAVRREMGYALNVSMFIVVVLLIPFITYLPTFIVQGGYQLKQICFGVASGIPLIALCVLGYAQSQVAAATDQVLTNFDKFITDNITSFEPTKEHSDRLKAIIEVRDSLRKNVTFPFASLAGPLIQSATLIAGLSKVAGKDVATYTTFIKDLLNIK